MKLLYVTILIVYLCMSNEQKQEIMTKEIKKYCKDFGYKFEKIIDGGFITSRRIDVFAGMEVCLLTGNVKNHKIRKVGSRVQYEKHLCFEDGDIIGDGIINEIY